MQVNANQGDTAKNNAFENSVFEPLLLQGAARLGVTLTEQHTTQLLRYLELLGKWNKAYNLTAVRKPEEMLYRHLLDSLSVAPWVSGRSIIDVGTGPGLPGIPLSILYPDSQFTLLDSNGKKTRFLTQCKLELGLSNITVVHGRVEAFQPVTPFDQVVSRAFSAIANMVNWCGHLVDNSGRMLAMKGVFPEEELASLPGGYHIEATHALDVPGCDGERHLIIITKTSV